MKVVYNVGNEKHEAENVSITIGQTPKIIIDQDKSLIDYSLAVIQKLIYPIMKKQISKRRMIS